MKKEETTATVVEGSPDKTGSQVESPSGKPDAALQTATPPKVEGDGQRQASRSPSERPKASDYYKSRAAEKKWRRDLEERNKALEQMVLDQNNKIESITAVSLEEKRKQEAQELQTLYQEDPQKWIERREQLMKDSLKSVLDEFKSKELPKYISNIERERSVGVDRQAALEQLFPDDGSKLSIEERISSSQDSERTRKILEVFSDPELGLNELSKVNPKKAVEVTLKLIGEVPASKQEPQTKIPPPMVRKEQMASTARSGSPAGGKGATMTLNEIREKRRKLDEESEKNPELRHDDRWLAEAAFLKQELLRLSTESTQ